MNKLPVIYLCCFATAFLTEILFPGLPNQAGNLRKFQGMGVSQASPGKEIPGAGALKQKCPPLGIWIFFGTTRYIFSFLWDQCALYPVNRSQKNEIEQNNARQTDLNE